MTSCCHVPTILLCDPLPKLYGSSPIQPNTKRTESRLSLLTYFIDAARVTMAITTLDPSTRHDEGHMSTVKIGFIVVMFVISLASFVSQTELTAQAYDKGWKEPLVLLFVTHGSWWVFWPVQALGTAAFKTGVRTWKKNNLYQPVGQRTVDEGGEGVLITPKVGILEYFSRSVIKQIHNVYHTAILIYESGVNDNKQTSNLQVLIDQNVHLPTSGSVFGCVKALLATPVFRYIYIKAAIITIVLTVAGLTWYAAIGLTYASNVTAIYNCSAFTAYVFAIPILHEKFSWLKMSSVLVAISGVFVVAYSGDSSNNDEDHPYKMVGNLLISGGAVLYGYYEVLYKKYLCVPPHLAPLITPRRQLTFANFIMGLLGLTTSLLLIILFIVSELFGIHHFNWSHYGKETGVIWGYISGSIVSNMLFSASFLTLMALTSPVLSSVSSLLTIFLVGIVEWVVFGIRLGPSQLAGDFLVIVGFVILTVASWKEISEGADDDEVEAVSTYSFAVSQN